MTIKEFQRRALNIQGVYLPDVLDILKEIFNVSSVDVIIDGDKELDSRSIEILDRLNKKEPSAYIIGHIQFAGMTIKVNPNVLIPRMETEELVLNLCETTDFSNKKILDLCCGSGCIGLSIAKRFPSSTVILSDISKEAINVAEENKRINDINNATFVVSDFLESIKDKFDYIISNPPYIPEGTKTETSYEPDLALFSGIDGLDSYRKIINKLPFVLKEKGEAFFEIEDGREDDLLSIVDRQGIYKGIIKKDLANKARFMYLKKKIS